LFVGELNAEKANQEQVYSDFCAQACGS